MIESLESKRFLSVTPHAALTTLRSDLAGIGHQVNQMIVANNAAVANLQRDMSIFPTHLTSDRENLRVLNVRFRSTISTLANDFNTMKVLIGQDIAQLITDANTYNRKPTVAFGSAFESTQQLLSAQTIAAANQLTEDAGFLQIGYQQALALISASHPLDATLVTRVSHISTALGNNTAAIYNIATTVALTDTPNFIRSLEPTGVITTIA